MAVLVQVALDAADPQSQARFWAAAAGYVVEAEDQADSAAACVDPEGVGPRLYFQRVPEPKSVKNRVHLDLKPGVGRPPDERRAVARADAERLVGLGARVLREHDDNGEFWIVLADPESNEFCVS
jgi:hypothetical protein